MDCIAIFHKIPDHIKYMGQTQVFFSKLSTQVYSFQLTICVLRQLYFHIVSSLLHYARTCLCDQLNMAEGIVYNCQECILLDELSKGKPDDILQQCFGVVCN